MEDSHVLNTDKYTHRQTCLLNETTSLSMCSKLEFRDAANPTCTPSQILCSRSASKSTARPVTYLIPCVLPSVSIKLSHPSSFFLLAPFLTLLIFFHSHHILLLLLLPPTPQASQPSLTPDTVTICFPSKNVRHITEKRDKLEEKS